MSTARKTAIVAKASAVPETAPSEPDLRMDVNTLLYAFELAEPHAKGRSYKERLNNQMDVALGIIDWAICESDRGAQLLKEKTRADYGR
jgi:hypothetical protein